MKITIFSKLMLVAIAVFTLAACTAKLPQQSASNSKLTAGEVDKNIIKGQTTQDQVVKTFGSPNIITKNASGQEVWTYNRMSFDASAGSGFGGMPLIAGSSQALSSTTSKSVDLIITFNSKYLVEDYQFISSSY